MSVVLLHPLVSLLGADAAAVHATRSFVAVMLAFVPVLASASSSTSSSGWPGTANT
ncbi:MAG: hypothetical protein ACR2M5_09940 [Nakamurella sp.]